MTRRQKYIFVLVAVCVAVTRIWAISRTAWDWDETLFGLGIRDFNIALHHPQPPGFPVFIWLAKVVHFLVPSEFGAVQAVTVTFALLLFPACYFAGRSFGFSFDASVVLTLILCFLPNVWFYGGTGFSDVPGLVLELVAAGSLLRGRTDRRWYFLGSLILAFSVGIRVQTILVGATPFVLALVANTRRRLRDGLYGLLIVFVSTLVIYATAVAATGTWGDYLNAFHVHQEYVLRVDSFHNPGRPTPLELFVPFLFYPFGDRGTAGVIAFLVGSSVLGCRSHGRRLLLILLTFSPFFVFALFMLDPLSISRLSIGYMPLLAFLAGSGIESISALLIPFDRWKAVTVTRCILTAYCVLRAVSWTVPSLEIVRQTASPPIAAMNWIREHRPRQSIILVSSATMHPFAQLFLSDYQVRPAGSEIEPEALSADAVYVTEGTDPAATIVFRRGGTRLRRLARNRYFAVSVSRVSNFIEFTRGWYDAEENGFRWMSGRGEIVLASGSRPRLLKLDFEIPYDAFAAPPIVTLDLDGRSERFEAHQRFLERVVVVPSGNRGHRLAITTTQTVNPAARHLSGDTRHLGLRLLTIEYLKK